MNKAFQIPEPPLRRTISTVANCGMNNPLVTEMENRFLKNQRNVNDQKKIIPLWEKNLNYKWRKFNEGFVNFYRVYHKNLTKLHSGEHQLLPQFDDPPDRMRHHEWGSVQEHKFFVQEDLAVGNPVQNHFPSSFYFASVHVLVKRLLSVRFLSHDFLWFLNEHNKTLSKSLKTADILKNKLDMNKKTLDHTNWKRSSLRSQS